MFASFVEICVLGLCRVADVDYMYRTRREDMDFREVISMTVVVSNNA